MSSVYLVPWRPRFLSLQSQRSMLTYATIQGFVLHCRERQLLLPESASHCMLGLKLVWGWQHSVLATQEHSAGWHRQL